MEIQIILDRSGLPGQYIQQIPGLLFVDDGFTLPHEHAELILAFLHARSSNACPSASVVTACARLTSIFEAAIQVKQCRYPPGMLPTLHHNEFQLFWSAVVAAVGSGGAVAYTRNEAEALSAWLPEVLHEIVMAKAAYDGIPWFSARYRPYYINPGALMDAIRRFKENIGMGVCPEMVVGQTLGQGQLQDTQWQVPQQEDDAEDRMEEGQTEESEEAEEAETES